MKINQITTDENIWILRNPSHYNQGNLSDIYFFLTSLKRNE